MSPKTQAQLRTIKSLIDRNQKKAKQHPGTAVEARYQGRIEGLRAAAAVIQRAEV